MNEEANFRIEKVIEKKLAVLDLADLSLTYLDLPFEELSHVNTIFLHGNDLQRLPKELTKLNELAHLDVSSNYLDELPNDFTDLVNLKILKISDNTIKYLPNDFGRLVNLIELDISGNGMDALPDSFIDLTDLKILNAGDNELKTLPDGFGQLRNLVQLYFYANELTFLPYDFGNLVSLTALNINNNQLETLPESFNQLVNLQNLETADNELVDLPEKIGFFEFLRNLNLANNNLSYLPQSFSSFYRLLTFNVSGNQISALPEGFGSHGFFREINLNSNELTHLPDSIGLARRLVTLRLSRNRLESLPDGFSNLRLLMTLDASNNQLAKLPDDFGLLRNLQTLNLSNNNLTHLPKSIVSLRKMISFNIRDNKINHFIDELRSLNDARLMIDYRGNPFFENALARAERFTVIWKDVPYRLREILKIYFDGFNIFYNERTKKVINLKVFNEEEGLVFDLENKVDSDPEMVETLLNEYYEILKDKLQEGVGTGLVFTKSTDDTAHLFAQQQVTYLAQNATLAKLAVKDNITNSEVIRSLVGFIESMEGELHTALHENTSLRLELHDKNLAVARLEERSGAYEGEILHRRQEALTRAGTPMQISMSQQMTLTNQVSTDFGKIRELLDDHLSRFQREEASKLQEKIDTVAAKPAAATAEEKKVLGSGLKRWLESVQGSLKAGTEIAKSATELSKYWDKLKDFSETVLNDPQLGDTIDTVKKMIEGAM